jgi:hypothetical protein
MQTESLIGTVGWGDMGIPKIMVFNTFWKDPCVLVLLCEKINFTIKLFLISFLGGDISGHKDKMKISIKATNKFWFKVYKIVY